MNWQVFMNNIALLEMIKVFIFVGSFVFATAYLLPRGIIFFFKWKDAKKSIYLSISITSFAVGMLMLIYLSVFFIFDLLKKTS